MELDRYQQISQLAEEFIKYNELNGAFRLYEELGKLIDSLPAKHPNLDKYRRIQKRLKAFAISFFEEDDYFDLIKNDFEYIFDLPDYDFWERVKLLLMLTPNFEARDKLKTRFRQALGDCRRPLLASGVKDDMPKAVGDWIKDFVIHLGPGKIDPVKKQEYLASGFPKQLDADGRVRVRRLLDLYEKLNLSSLEKDGMENSVPMQIDEDFFVLDQGSVQELGNDMKAVKSVKGQAAPLADILSDKPAASVPENPSLSPLQMLEEEIKKYPPSSLEYKAISQEIMRFQKAAARKNAQKQ